MKSKVIVGYFLVALLLVSMFFINTGFSSTILEQENDWTFTTSTRNMSPRSLVGSDTGYYLTAGSKLNVSWSGDPNGWPVNPATSMRFYLLDSSQIGGFQWVVSIFGQWEKTNAGYLEKLDSWQKTYSCLINYTDTYYVIFCCEGYYYIYDPILSFPWIDVLYYEALVTSPPQVSISPSSATIDRGQSQLLTSTVSSGTPPYTYQWFLDEVAVPGATSPTWTFTSTSAGIFAVNVKVNDSAGYSVYSSFALVYVNLPPSVSISPTSVIMYVGQSQLFTSTVSYGTSPYSYQWYLNGGQIPGATSSSWIFTPQTPGSYIQIYVIITDNVGVQATSNTATVTVKEGTGVSVWPSSVIMDAGQSQLFTSAVSGGTPPYSYQWYLFGGDISTNVIVNPGFETGDLTGWNSEVPDDPWIRSDEHHTGSYACASPYVPSSYLPFRITQKLPNISSNFVTSVGCWRKWGTASYDWLRVNYTDGEVSSIALWGPSIWTYVTLNLLPDHTVDSLIIEKTYYSGVIFCVDDVEFIVNGAQVSGATGSTWTFTPDSAGTYNVYVQVTDNLGFSATSNMAAVTVHSAPSVSISPSSVVMNVGQSQLFTSSVTGGTSPFAYQWFLNGFPVSGATSATWAFIPVSAGSYYIYLNVTDNVGVEAESNIALVTVYPATQISIDPIQKTVTVGPTFTVNVNVSNVVNMYAYEFRLTWNCSVVELVSAVRPAGNFMEPTIDPANYFVPVWKKNESRSGDLQTAHFGYTLLVPELARTGSGILVTLTFRALAVGATLLDLNDTRLANDVPAPIMHSHLDGLVTVNPPPSVTISPTSVVMAVGQSRLFTSTVSGGISPFSHQWYLNDALVPGATNQTWTFVPISAGSYEVYVNVTDNVGAEAKSNIALVTVNPPPSVTILPTPVVMDVGQSQLFSSTVSGGSSPYSCQWFLNGFPVSGATSATWTFVPVIAGSYSVYVNVTDGVGVEAKSNIALVTVNPPPSVTILPTSVVMDVGQSQLFASTVSGGTSPFGYQWYLNGVAVSGATSATWSFTPSFTGFYDVYVNVTDGVSFSAKSNNAIAIVNPPISVTISPTSVVMTVSQSQLFTSSVANGTPPYSYQWYLDDTPVSGATSHTWAFTPTTNGTYHVFLSVTDSVSGTAQSNAALVTVVSGVHDIALTGITNSKSGCLPFPTIGQNDTCQINVTVSNLGDYSESFNVTVYVNSIEIKRIAVIDLAPNTTRVLTVNWFTIGFAKGNYTINALAEPVIGETNTTNNSIIGETVAVVVQGDINGDGIVNIIDIVRVALAFGAVPANPNWDPNADINGDKIINIIDIAIVALHFGETG